jgi:hypothetical protein
MSQSLSLTMLISASFDSWLQTSFVLHSVLIYAVNMALLLSILVSYPSYPSNILYPHWQQHQAQHPITVIHNLVCYVDFHGWMQPMFLHGKLHLILCSSMFFKHMLVCLTCIAMYAAMFFCIFYIGMSLLLLVLHMRSL